MTKSGLEMEHTMGSSDSIRKARLHRKHGKPDSGLSLGALNIRRRQK